MAKKLNRKSIRTQPSLYCGPGPNCKAASLAACKAIAGNRQCETEVVSHDDTQDDVSIHPDKPQQVPPNNHWM